VRVRERVRVRVCAQQLPEVMEYYVCVCVYIHTHIHTHIHTQRLPEVMDSSGQEAVWAPVGQKFSTVCTKGFFSITFPGVLTFENVW